MESFMSKTLGSTPMTGARILLVEDNEASRQLMSDYLEYYGYKVMGLAKGAQFGAAMAQFRPHLVLLDLKLPDVDGYSLLQQRQWHADWLEIPVIVISAFAFQADQQRALKLGASQYLVKPVSLTQLKQSILQELNYQLV
ncbi:response regulator [Leptolyngbya sp. NK1-12]|uniref:Response regulator n=2 Tax=Leptolyngbya sp. NK1-12 TaxID=2547451 RepID=A0AA96WBL6_9CYAN|nr:MAG: response regulator [Leptolyngbya sp. IPPAS B-1204]WNZ23362.1 response regulator [Leptolyngbya sp. NK1-12]